MTLRELAEAIGATVAGDGDGSAVEVREIAIDSRRVAAGDLFVALDGARSRGRDFVPDALARGAAAVCATAPVPGVPTIVVEDARCAVADLAAAMYGHPARELTLVGITGSLGKTSTALLLQGMLVAAGIRTGVIGSLGIHWRKQTMETGMTTPEAPTIHAAMRRMVESGVAAAVMEVTSHAILHERVRGLEFALGLITNLVPDEHLEFHPTPEHYVRTKSRFYGMLRPDAPLIINADDATVRRTTLPYAEQLVGVTMDEEGDAPVRVRGFGMTSRGSAFTLDVRHTLPCLVGGAVRPQAIPLALSILGRQQVGNAALAAVAALILGAEPEAIRRALAQVRPIRRRMQLVDVEGGEAPTILDDTVGNPASIHVVFETARALPHDRLRVAYAIRGLRGPAINQHNAAALAREVLAGGAELVVTAAEDSADARNRVSDEEREVALATLREAGAPFHYEPTLAATIRRTLNGATPRDLVMLLGAQGMDRGAELAREELARRG